MRPIVTDRVHWSVVGPSVTIVIYAKTAEPLEMPFGFGFVWAQESMAPYGEYD